MTMATTAGILATNARRSPDRDALVFGERTRSYREVDAAVNRTAHALAAAGLRKGDRMLLASGNSDDFVIALYAAWRLGAIAVPVNPASPAGELRYLLDDAKPAVVLFGPPALAAVAACIAEAPPFLTSPPIALAPMEGYAELAVLASSCPETEPGVEVGESDDAAIFYTSGTTGRPKGALIDHHRLVWVGINTALVMGLREGDRILHAAPMYHSADLAMLVVGGTQVGGTHVILPLFTSEGVLETIERHEINVFFGVPTMYQLMLRDPGFADRNLTSWRVGVFGAAPMPASAVQAALDALPGLELIQACGQTEGGPGGIYSSAAEVRARPDASGRRALPNTEARIVTPSGADVEPGAPGELILRGETIMKGYWQNPEATADAIREGWLHTGDIATIDADHYITLVDRMKDMIISGGRNIYSVEVENALAAHPAVAEIAVISRKHSEYGETVIAVVDLRPGHALTLDELRDFGADLISKYKLPRELVLRSIPRSPSGKALKHVLRDELLAIPAK
jgi:fatty-acyl-CoA synthase